jgi:hypothetical protein
VADGEGDAVAGTVLVATGLGDGAVVLAGTAVALLAGTAVLVGGSGVTVAGTGVSVAGTEVGVGGAGATVGEGRLVGVRVGSRTGVAVGVESLSTAAKPAEARGTSVGGRARPKASVATITRE